MGHLRHGSPEGFLEVRELWRFGVKGEQTQLEDPTDCGTTAHHKTRCWGPGLYPPCTKTSKRDIKARRDHVVQLNGPSTGRAKI
jgi:hypothetical protein